MTEQRKGGATLGGIAGQGYGVVESLASLGKGRRLNGLFRTGLEHRARLADALAARTRVVFEGPVHFRHHDTRHAIEVELARLTEEKGELLAEFVAQDVPYSL